MVLTLGDKAIMMDMKEIGEAQSSLSRDKEITVVKTMTIIARDQTILVLITQTHEVYTMTGTLHLGQMDQGEARTLMVLIVQETIMKTVVTTTDMDHILEKDPICMMTGLVT